MRHSTPRLGTAFFQAFLLAGMYLLLNNPVMGTPAGLEASAESDSVLSSLPPGLRELAEQQRARLDGEGAPQRGTVVTLRVGSGCTYATVQAAVDAAGSGATTTTVIRVRSGTYTQAVNIASKNIRIIGGHADCSTTTPTGSSTIRPPAGGGVNAVVFTPGTGGGTNERSLELTHLRLEGGVGSALTPGGGLTVLPIGAARAHVTLDSVVITGNQGLRGGGIALLQTGSALGGSLSMINTTIEGNSAAGASPHGGGLYCSGEGYAILKIGGEVTANTAGADGGANGRGGGIFLEQCQMAWFAQDATTGEARLADNIAYGIGGGLFARDGAIVNWYGQHFFANRSTRPLRIQGNVARSSAQGGGAGITSDSGASINLFATWLVDNRAEISGLAEGGAARVTGGGRINWNRTSSTAVICHHRTKCSLIRNNRAADLGAVVFASGTDSVASINQTWVSHNYHTAAMSSGSIVAFANARVRIESSVLTRAEKLDDHPNPARPTRLLHLSSGGRIDMLYSTVAYHSMTVTPFLFMGLSPQLFLRGSIIVEPPGLALGTDSSQAPPEIDSDCTLWSDASLTTIGTGVHTRNLLTSNPGFLGPDDFRLAEGSPAIDYCNSQTFGFGPPPEFDITGRARGVWTTPGLLGSSPLHGPFDLGAFEMPVDRIFNDRFQGVPGPI